MKMPRVPLGRAEPFGTAARESSTIVALFPPLTGTTGSGSFAVHPKRARVARARRVILPFTETDCSRTPLKIEYIFFVPWVRVRSGNGGTQTETRCKGLKIVRLQVGGLCR